jgi:hypothetical protein
LHHSPRHQGAIELQARSRRRKTPLLNDALKNAHPLQTFQDGLLLMISFRDNSAGLLHAQRGYFVKFILIISYFATDYFIRVGL